jgi:hypothetical protein
MRLALPAAVAAPAALALTLAAGCSSTAQPAQRGAALAAAPSPAAPPSAAEVELVMLKDPLEGAFTLQMPRGWANRAHLVRRGWAHPRTVATTLSPDNQTLLFFGDPEVPTYTEPYRRYDDPLPTGSDGEDIKPYQKAEAFLPDYVEKKFGRLPGFRLTGAVEPNPGLERHVKAAMKRLNVSEVPFSTALATFEYTGAAGTPIPVLVNCMTAKFADTWTVDISGVASADGGDPRRHNDLLFRIAASHRPDPKWMKKERQAWAERQAELIGIHERRIEDITPVVRPGRSRIQPRLAYLEMLSKAARRKAYARQARENASHGRFLNCLLGETTVVHPGTREALQVEAGHDRYFLHKVNRTFVGTDKATDRAGLRKRGLNPDDYEECMVQQQQ